MVHDPRGDQSLGDCWSIKEKELNLPSKEMLAMCYALEACPIRIRDCRVDVVVSPWIPTTAKEVENPVI